MKNMFQQFKTSVAGDESARAAAEGHTIFSTVLRVPSTELGISGLSLGTAEAIESVERNGFRLEQMTSTYQQRNHMREDVLLLTCVFRRVV